MTSDKLQTEEWWQVEQTDTTRIIWQDTECEGSYYSTLEEAQKAAASWASQAHPHRDGSTRYYDARIIRVIELRQVVEVQKSTSNHTP